MPPESAGRAGARKPALALLMGLALLLIAHVVACAVHSAGHHGRPAAVASSSPSPTQASARCGAPVLLSPSDTVLCSAGHGGDEHPGHGAVCCDPAHWPAEVRAPVQALFLVLQLLALLVLRRPGTAVEAYGAPPGRSDTADVSSLTGPHLLRLVCVSRT
ncbi:hypothetical protein [Streptomyces melanogenes]|uniref:hypothetical protein n=1 Tax=Streptomyces melanogenes TaxID=67326 RepID=UPI00167CF084|nr:hypothetical protein [Streptomyces melanogenes]